MKIVPFDAARVETVRRPVEGCSSEELLANHVLVEPQNGHLAVVLTNPNEDEMTICLVHHNVIGGPLVRFQKESAPGQWEDVAPWNEMYPDPNYQPLVTKVVLPPRSRMALPNTCEYHAGGPRMRITFYTAKGDQVFLYPPS